MTVMKARFHGNSMARVFVTFTVLLVSLPGLNLFGQSQTPPAGSANGNGQAATVVTPSKDYLISPGDVIEIKVEDAPELSKSFRVNASGTINFGFLGLLNIEKKSAEDVSVMIADGLRGRYLKNPQVSVTITQFYSQTYFIQGAVGRPGVYQVEGKPNMLELLTIAGGLAQNSGSTAFIIRKIKYDSENKAASAVPASASSAAGNGTSPQKPSTDDEELPEYELITTNISGLLKGNFDQNIVIKPGDIINVPQSDLFYVGGEVKAPGSFSLRDGTTVQQAITMAQGLTFKSKSGDSVIFREDPKTKKREEIKIDVGAIMAGKKPDVPILANDMIIVPNSRMKTISGTLLSGLGANAMRIPY